MSQTFEPQILNHPLIQHKISLMRKKETGSKDFRELASEVATLMCYEATRDLPLKEVTVDTPICRCKTKMLAGRKLAIVPILRAGLGMVDGMLTLIPAAKVGHIGLYRDEETAKPIEYFCKLPCDISEREVIVVDPMLATGGSAIDAVGMIKKHGATNIKFMCIIAAPEGLAAFGKVHPDVKVYVGVLDEKLNVTTVTVKLEYGEQAAHLDSKEQLEQGHGFHRTLSDQETPKIAPLGSVRYDLIGKLVEETRLTHATIAAILQRMTPQKFAMFRLNPEEFILKTAKIINDQMATQIIEHITYSKLDAAYDTDIFTSANLRGKLGLNAMEANRSLYSHIIYDSENEKQFVGELDVNAKVAVYVKLPGGFFISTPVGKYNPDWAIAFNEGSVKHIYFIAETKGNSDAAELRGVEKAKIACAKAHFAAISSESVTYSVVDSFTELMNIVS